MDLHSTAFLHNMTQPEAERALGRGTAVVVAGSVEQHGGHLPLGTDAFAALGIAGRVAKHLDAPIVSLGHVGVAPYHLSWAGSLSLRPETFMRLFEDVVGGLVLGGAHRILVVNWHEGNTPSIRLAADAVQREHPTAQILVGEGHIATNSLFPDEMEFTHAGNMETAGVLAYHPDLVVIDGLRAGDEIDRGTRAHALYRQRTVFPILRDFRDIAETGWYGDPTDISIERAQQIIAEVAAHIADEALETWASLE